MRRATIAAGLTLVLLAATASSAGAATFTPANRGLREGSRWAARALPQIFTLTKSSTETSFELVDAGSVTEHETHFGAHARFQATERQVPLGVSSARSTLTDEFPELQGLGLLHANRAGTRTTATIFSDTGEYGPPQAGAPVISLSGVGVAKKCKKAKKGAVAAKKKKCKKKN